jgi:hypothetical protein
MTFNSSNGTATVLRFERVAAGDSNPVLKDNRYFAKKCASVGLYVFPCWNRPQERRHKRPMVKWRDLSTTDTQQIEAWWAKWPEALPAIDLGKSGYLIIDGDRHGGPDGVAAFEVLVADHQQATLFGVLPTIITPTTGKHYYFRQSTADEPLGNSEGAIKGQAINVRGDGGYAIAPGAQLPDGRRYSWDKSTPNFFKAVRENTVPPLPPWLATLLRPAKPEPVRDNAGSRGQPGKREQAYAVAALENLADELSRMPPDSGRNNKANESAFKMGTMVARGWIDRSEIEYRLLSACFANGLVKEDGEIAVRRTLKSGLDAGEREPHGELEDREPTNSIKRRQEDIHSWDDPDWSILDDTRGKLPPFPTDVFSEPIQRWLERTAHGAGTMVDHVAIPVLGTVSSLIGTARRIAASRSYVQPVASWMAVIGWSGTGKTPGMNPTIRAMSSVSQLPFFRKLVADLKGNHDKAVARAAAELRKWQASVKEAADKGEDTPDKPKAAEHPGRFIEPKLYVSDITIEQIAVRLQLRPGRLLVVRDELAAVFLNMSRYANGGQDNEFWLESWNGLPYHADRKTTEPVWAPYNMVGILGGFQPDKMARSFKGDDDGMYTRVLFAWPEEAPYRKLSNDVDEDEPELVNALARIVNLPTDGTRQSSPDGQPGEERIAFVPRRIPLSADAVAEFELFRKWMFQERGALFGRESEWLAKGPSHVLRLAGTVIYLEWAWGSNEKPEEGETQKGAEEPREVSKAAVKAAIRLVKDYFWPHSRAALRRAGLSQRHNDERTVLTWARARGKTELSREDVRHNALSQRLDAEQTQRLLDGLVKAGWLRQVVKPPGAKRRQTGLSVACKPNHDPPGGNVGNVENL